MDSRSYLLKNTSGFCNLKILRQDNYLKILLQFNSCFNGFYPVFFFLLVSTIWKSKLLWRYLWFLVGLTVAREKDRHCRRTFRIRVVVLQVRCCVVRNQATLKKICFYTRKSSSLQSLHQRLPWRRNVNRKMMRRRARAPRTFKPRKMLWLLKVKLHYVVKHPGQTPPPPPGQTPAPLVDGYCSGRYASYWNAFLYCD